MRFISKFMRSIITIQSVVTRAQIDYAKKLNDQIDYAKNSTICVVPRRSFNLQDIIWNLLLPAILHVGSFTKHYRVWFYSITYF